MSQITSEVVETYISKPGKEGIVLTEGANKGELFKLSRHQQFLD